MFFNRENARLLCNIAPALIEGQRLLSKAKKDGQGSRHGQHGFIVNPAERLTNSRSGRVEVLSTILAPTFESAEARPFLRALRCFPTRFAIWFFMLLHET